jgi:hypothetical protein
LSKNKDYNLKNRFKPVLALVRLRFQSTVRRCCFFSTTGRCQPRRICGRSLYDGTTVGFAQSADAVAVAAVESAAFGSAAVVVVVVRVQRMFLRNRAVAVVAVGSEAEGSF